MPRSATPKFNRIAPAERQASLIDAGLRCLARGGMAGFTVSQICAEAGVSPGLVLHHFGSKDGLLTAVYETMMQRLVALAEPDEDGDRERSPLQRFIAASFSADPVARSTLRAWLALWGEIASNPVLLKAHRRQYGRYREAVEKALAAESPRADKETIRQQATLLISLIDGLWLEWCIDPQRISPHQARAACLQLIAALRKDGRQN